MTTTDEMVLRKTVTVKRDPESAFRLFTDGIATWWPLATHSISDERAISCSLDGRVGGLILETDDGGKQHQWGTITAWQPPHRVAFTWHPGRTAETVGCVEVRFSPAPGGGTLVELEHRGWEKLGDRAQEAFEGYDSGWGRVLGECYAQAADAA